MLWTIRDWNETQGGIRAVTHGKSFNFFRLIHFSSIPPFASRINTFVGTKEERLSAISFIHRDIVSLQLVKIKEFLA